ncbi:hypothetical protein BDV24DRAFT_89193 [Aspergillus arachidicola]|uniref:Uncharacterized protein n=1 Tax=Aspergillus arachidicola TaxID=656916 RepID=A0A5N6Y1G8_9EURO|nr:hypothetical protein BDV24DRAFT_89193 [Aspergillus arachidicola]
MIVQDGRLSTNYHSKLDHARKFVTGGKMSKHSIRFRKTPVTHLFRDNPNRSLFILQVVHIREGRVCV